MLNSYITVENFFSDADRMRTCIDHFFGDPDHDSGISHQIWNYWHVPGLYTYLRTEPTRVIPLELMEQFLQLLQHWSIGVLGLSRISHPYLSLYINGCGQGLHNDAGNGRWGFVYSLTHWDAHRFTGGETLIFKDSPYLETEAIRHPTAGLGLYDLVPPRFNQLLVFDDRLIHAVPSLQGGMSPREGRIVIHGHIGEGGVQVQGTLSHRDVARVLYSVQPYVDSQLASFARPFHGCIAVRLTIACSGVVVEAVKLTDRILRTRPSIIDTEQFTSDLVAFLQTLHFPVSNGQTLVTIPIVVT